MFLEPLVQQGDVGGNDGRHLSQVGFDLRVVRRQQGQQLTPQAVA
jgi:hypothetical protein